MINLKLAQYNSEGKFERFLELGKDFTFGGDYVVVNSEGWRHLDPILEHKYPVQKLFDGLFLGRTYGGGRFVLIEYTKYIDKNKNNVYQDDVILTRYSEKSFLSAQEFYELVKWGFYSDGEYVDNVECWNRGNHSSLTDRGGLHGEPSSEILVVGNLHENPELWEKLK